MESFWLSIGEDFDIFLCEDTPSIQIRGDTTSRSRSEKLPELSFTLDEYCKVWEEAKENNKIGILGKWFQNSTQELLHQFQMDALTDEGKAVIIKFLSICGHIHVAKQQKPIKMDFGENLEERPTSNILENMLTDSQMCDCGSLLVHMLHGFKNGCPGKSSQYQAMYAGNDDEIPNDALHNQTTSTRVDDESLSDSLHGETVCTRTADDEILCDTMQSETVCTRSDDEILDHTMQSKLMYTRTDDETLNNTMQNETTYTRSDDETATDTLNNQTASIRGDNETLSVTSCDQNACTRTDDETVDDTLCDQTLCTRTDDEVLTVIDQTVSSNDDIVHNEGLNCQAQSSEKWDNATTQEQDEELHHETSWTITDDIVPKVKVEFDATAWPKLLSRLSDGNKSTDTDNTVAKSDNTSVVVNDGAGTSREVPEETIKIKIEDSSETFCSGVTKRKFQTLESSYNCTTSEDETVSESSAIAAEYIAIEMSEVGEDTSAKKIKIEGVSGNSPCDSHLNSANSWTAQIECSASPDYFGNHPSIAGTVPNNVGCDPNQAGTDPNIVVMTPNHDVPHANDSMLSQQNTVLSQQNTVVSQQSTVMSRQSAVPAQHSGGSSILRSMFFNDASTEINNLRRDEEKPFACYCGRKFESEGLMKMHELYHKGGNPNQYSCDKCGERFDVKSDLETHFVSYHQTDEANHTCDACGQTFEYKTHLQGHYRLVHAKRNKCEICKLEFERASELRVHLITHKQPKSYRCDSCNICFDEKSAMSEHKKLHIKKLQKDKSGLFYSATKKCFVFTVGNTFECEVCDQIFTSKRLIETHVWMTHKQLHPYECEICGNIFRTRHSLNRHYLFSH
ncbi:uncharacterized protein LOC144450205 [Glandiceps talaboti]